jgi:tetratricopeptide (TPR) repeat protein
MPTTTYMVVDPRHDHGFRVPRPSRSAALEAPDACSACHKDRPAAWIADAMQTWYPAPRPDPLAFGDAFAAADRGAPGAQRALLAIVDDVERPAFVRASALSRLARFVAPSLAEVAAGSLEDRDPNVRMAAVAFFSATDVVARLKHLTPSLSDPSRVVRMGAARAFAGEAEPRLAPGDRARFEAALAEYVAAQRFNADRPESAANLGTLAMERGQRPEAEAALRRALALDPTFVHAAVNLADVLKTVGREADGERVLRESFARNPGSAVLLHALGLSLVRQKRTQEARQALGEAVERDPETPRFAYVYAVALHDTGDPARAAQVLESALRRHPFDRDLLFAAIAYDRQAGRESRAAERERLLRRLEPEAFR